MSWEPRGILRDSRILLWWALKCKHVLIPDSVLRAAPTSSTSPGHSQPAAHPHSTERGPACSPHGPLRPHPAQQGLLQKGLKSWLSGHTGMSARLVRTPGTASPPSCMGRTWVCLPSPWLCAQPVRV